MIKFPYPFRNVLCIGRNYADHALELENEIPAAPVVFCKPISAIALSGTPFVIPTQSKNVHYECELVLVMGQSPRGMAPGQLLQAVSGICVGVDFTARDLQDQAKAKGLPWCIAKGMDGFAGLGSFSDRSEFDLEAAFLLEFKVNGKIRQSGVTSQMSFSFSEIISFLSERFNLGPGDLIYTGTPAGVGAIKSGDQLVGTVNQDGRVLSQYESHVE